MAVKEAAADARAKRKEPQRTQDPEGVKRNILEIASEEFALNGLAGARIDEIAARTRTSKRMIYYYFGGKEGLYIAALESAYRLVREGEAKLDVEGLAPIDSLKKIVEFTFDHHHRHEDFIRMVMIENIHHGEYLEQSKAIRQLNVSAIDTMESVYRRGVADGSFRKGLDPIELHWQVSALCFFNVSNRATFSKIFGRDVGSSRAQASLRRNVVDMVLRFVAKPSKLLKE